MFFFSLLYSRKRRLSKVQDLHYIIRNMVMNIENKLRKVKNNAREEEILLEMYKGRLLRIYVCNGVYGNQSRQLLPAFCFSTFFIVASLFGIYIRRFDINRIAVGVIFQKCGLFSLWGLIFIISIT